MIRRNVQSNVQLFYAIYLRETFLLQLDQNTLHYTAKHRYKDTRFLIHHVVCTRSSCSGTRGLDILIVRITRSSFQIAQGKKTYHI